MSKFTHTVTRQQFVTASNNWNTIMNRLPQNNQFAYFTAFLGSRSYQQVVNTTDEQFVECTERAYNKIEMLNSPHARTLLKAFKAKYGYHREIP